MPQSVASSTGSGHGSFTVSSNLTYSRFASPSKRLNSVENPLTSTLHSVAMAERQIAHLRATVQDDTTGSIISQRPRVVTFTTSGSRFMRARQDETQSSLPSLPSIASSIGNMSRFQRVNDTQTSDMLRNINHTATNTIPRVEVTETSDVVKSRFESPLKHLNKLDNLLHITLDNITTTLNIPPVEATETFDLTPAAQSANVSTKRHELDDDPTGQLRTISPAKTHVKQRANNTRTMNNPTASSFIIAKDAQSPSVIQPPSYNKHHSIPFPEMEQDIYGNIDSVKVQAADLEKRLGQALRRIERRDEEIRTLKEQNFQVTMEMDQLSKSLAKSRKIETDLENGLLATEHKLQKNNARTAKSEARFDQLEQNLRDALGEVNAKAERWTQERGDLKSLILEKDSIIRTLQSAHPTLSSKARQVLDGLCKHNCKDCEICTRVKSFDTHTHSKRTIRVPKPVPVSQRMPEAGPHEDEPTMRPSMDPDLALNKVIKSVEAEVNQLKSDYARATTAYRNCDRSLGFRNRQDLKNRLARVQYVLEKKSNQVYRLYDVLEAHKDMSDGEMDMTITEVLKN